MPKHLSESMCQLPPKKAK